MFLRIISRCTRSADLVAASRRNFWAAVRADGVSPLGVGVVAEVLMDILFFVPPLRGSISFHRLPTLLGSHALPPQHSKTARVGGPVRSPSGWANFATRLRRWSATPQTVSSPNESGEAQGSSPLFGC